MGSTTDPIVFWNVVASSTGQGIQSSIPLLWIFLAGLIVFVAVTGIIVGGKIAIHYIFPRKRR